MTSPNPNILPKALSPDAIGGVWASVYEQEGVQSLRPWPSWSFRHAQGVAAFPRVSPSGDDQAKSYRRCSCTVLVAPAP